MEHLVDQQNSPCSTARLLCHSCTWGATVLTSCQNPSGYRETAAGSGSVRARLPSRRGDAYSACRIGDFLKWFLLFVLRTGEAHGNMPGRTRLRLETARSECSAASRFSLAGSRGRCRIPAQTLDTNRREMEFRARARHVCLRAATPAKPSALWSLISYWTFACTGGYPGVSLPAELARRKKSLKWPLWG